MNLRNIKTRNGKTVQDATRVGNYIVGLVDGRPLTWNLNGRRSNKNKSKLDISLTTYLVIRKWGSKYSVVETNNPNAEGRSVVKVVEL